jgi:hypothetical protein
VNIRIKLPFWYVISGMRQFNEKLWIMLSHKGDCMIDFLELNKRPAMSCPNLSVTANWSLVVEISPFEADTRTSIDGNSAAIELLRILSRSYRLSN